MVEDLNESRFFLNSDPKTEDFIFRLPRTWYSRPYEYAWASSFVGSDNVVLDAACGVSHPLKFYLCDKAKKVFANDIDGRLASPDAIRREIDVEYGPGASNSISEECLSKIEFSISSITDLPYSSDKFDRIFCISVLEHLRDDLNAHPSLPFNLWHLPIVRKSVFRSLREFKRTLKPGGLIVLTFDYPDINLEYFRRAVKSMGLKFAGPLDLAIPSNALCWEERKLYFFRALLTK